MLTADEMQTMIVEVASGIRSNESQLAPLSEDQLLFWSSQEVALLETQAERQIVSFTPEMPDLSTYRRGVATDLPS